FFFGQNLALAQQGGIYTQSDVFHPIRGQKGMVASQEARATQIGLDILKKGGNAIDAAVGVSFALAVTLPRAGNISGGGFMLVHLGKTGQTIAIDYREMAPLAASFDMYLNEREDVDKKLSQLSHKSTGVPGTVAGMAYVLKEYGTLSLKEVIAPAIRLAEEGIIVNEDIEYTLNKGKKRLQQWPETARIYYKPDGSVYLVGERMVFKDLAWSLNEIAENGPSAFYEGAIAEKLVADMKKHGGLITMEDLKNYRVSTREPVQGTYRGHEIIGMPPPSSGGIHIIQMLNILEAFPLGDMGPNSANSLHLIAESMKLAFADRSKYLGDPDWWDIPIKGLISKDYATELRAVINREKVTPSKIVNPEDPDPYESDETTHVSVMDQFGNVVSSTTTLNFSFGSGIVVPGTGMLLNNEMDNFTAKPGVPNSYGLLGGQANAIQPTKRPLSSMSPMILLKDGKPFLATGSPGGPRLINAILQVIINVIDHRMNIAEASNARRIHHQWKPDKLRVEKGFNPDTRRLLEEKGHQVRVTNSLGSTQSILKTEKGFNGSSDPRRSGALTLGY
ncbi:MAG: gamma-glutamyltranspeptidase/glutathione hydrolase, partial [Nitrospinales bacterium]